MANAHTPTFNFDLYVGTDKPNLLDQYNSAVTKIDKQILTTNDNLTIALEAARQASAQGAENTGKISNLEKSSFKPSPLDPVITPEEIKKLKVSKTGVVYLERS